MKNIVVLLLAVALTASITHGQNLLVNGNFESPASTAPATSWTTWAANVGGSSWQEHRTLASGDLISGAIDNTGIYDGTRVENVGIWNGYGSCGVYQIVGGGPNAIYTLTCDSGTQPWWLPYGEVRLIFLNATNGEISRFVVRTTDSIHAEYNGSTNRFDVGVPIQKWTNSAVSPLGTAWVKAEFSMNAGAGPGVLGGTCFFDNAVLTSPIVPPVITNIYPNGAVLQQATNRLSFNAVAAVGITNVNVALNGVDVSGSLVITGGLTNRAASYTNLQPNTAYTAAITVTDAQNISTSATVSFDTYAPSFSWEAEDYDFTSNSVPGQFINSPVLANTPTAGSYFGVIGTEGIDFHDYGADGPHAYRDPGTMATEACGDVDRQNYITAGVTNYDVGYFDGASFNGNVGIDYRAAEWVNYTRTFPAGTYNIYGRLAKGDFYGSMTLFRVVSGQGTSSQTTTKLGTFNVPNYGWQTYSYCPLTDQFGNLVKFTPSGTTTLRATSDSSVNFDFFMLVPADTNTPTITGVYPDGGTLLQATNKLTFTVSSPGHSIPQSSVGVTLNGVAVPAPNLIFTGSSSSWNVSAPLALGVTNYIALISVTNNLGITHSTIVYFDTFDPANYAIEAEDFDFGGGQFIDNPVITSAPAANSYFGQVGTDTVDSSFGDVMPPLTAPFRYRGQADIVSTDVCGDTRTRALVAAQLTNSLAFNYNVAYWSTNAWLNYTRTYPAGSFNVYARLAGGGGTPYAVRLDKVSPSTTNLGTFTAVGRGYNYFDWIPLVNTNTSQLVTVTLGGVATLRTTSLSGNVNPNSYLFVPAVSTPEPLHWSFSAGVLTLSWSNPAFHLQAQTNAPGAGLTSSWGNYPGGGTTPVNITVSQSPGSMFFRLSN